MPAAFPAARMGPTAALIAACTSAWPGLPRCPMEADKSEGPMKTPSTPDTSAISPSRPSASPVSTCTNTQICSAARFQIIARAPEIAGARRSRNAPPSIGRIAATLHGSMRFFGGLHEGQQYGLGPDIQYALDQYGIVPCRAARRKRPARYSPPAAEAGSRRFPPASVPSRTESNRIRIFPISPRRWGCKKCSKCRVAGGLREVRS